MKLITVNSWGGKLFDPFIKFIKEYSQQVDIFCFQEMYRSPTDKLISREMHSNIYGEIKKSLPSHQGYFATHLTERDLGGKVSFPLEGGLAIFINSEIKVNECKDIFIYRQGTALLNDDITTIPRNLQYISFSKENKDYLIGHFHGIWFPKSKEDTEDRIQQARKIKEFLSKRKEEKILCGDFNLLPNTKSMQILEEGMKNLIKEYNILTTRNRYYEREEKHADYVLISSGIGIKQFGIIDIEISDHLPLLFEFN